MNDGKIHVPAKKITPNNQGVIRITPEAMACLVEVVEESVRSIKQIASMIITQAVNNGLIRYDREDD